MVRVAQGERLGVYVSVPFCRAKCSFCNFASAVGTDAALELYVRALVDEIRSIRRDVERMGAALPERVDTVYFGGGTPSLLTPAQLGAIFAALRGEFVIEADAEITLEAAPGQIEADMLEAGMRDGVNRVSLGVQSFVDEECSAVGRTHTGESCREEFRRLRAAGVRDVGADLIAGLPKQTRASWERSLDAVCEAELQHASVYLLEVDEDSRLGAEVLRGGTRFGAREVGGDEIAAEMYERACEALPAAGYAQYEISNFAREGFQARHNRKYWERKPYLGLGLDAHSMLRGVSGGDVRFANTDELGSYGLAGRTVPLAVEEDAAFEESLFLGLRLVEGVSVGALADEFGGARVAAIRGSVRELVQGGLMTQQEGRWRLTMRGRLVSNEVFGELLAACV
jgi:oxygen-independent coproporphyrinogen-3 oxidase